MTVSHIHIKEQGKRLHGVLELGDGDREELWYESSEPLTTPYPGDPLLLGSLLRLMQSGHPVVVHGTVSQKLLANLEELQRVWAKWRPELYSFVEIDADDIVNDAPANTPNSAICAFSGGVDATFSMYRHLFGAVRYGRVTIDDALLVHGFDIPLSQPDTFERAYQRAQSMLASTNVTTRSIRTNLREIGQDWEDVFGLAVASCLTFFGGGHRVGVIGSSGDYGNLGFPWGSSPITDHLFSSAALEIRHDGAGFSRSEKVAELLNWPDALPHLRVCWQGDQLDRNCGRCEKCIRTMLNFRVFTDEVPACFDREPSSSEIRGLRPKNFPQLRQLRSIHATAQARSIDAPWVRDLAIAVQKGRVSVPLRLGAISAVRSADRLPVVGSKLKAARAKVLG